MVNRSLKTQFFFHRIRTKRKPESGRKERVSAPASPSSNNNNTSLAVNRRDLRRPSFTISLPLPIPGPLSLFFYCAATSFFFIALWHASPVTSFRYENHLYDRWWFECAFFFSSLFSFASPVRHVNPVRVVRPCWPVCNFEVDCDPCDWLALGKNGHFKIIAFLILLCIRFGCYCKLFHIWLGLLRVFGVEDNARWWFMVAFVIHVKLKVKSWCLAETIALGLYQTSLHILMLTGGFN